MGRMDAKGRRKFMVYDIKVRVSAWRGVDFVCGLTNEHEYMVMRYYEVSGRGRKDNKVHLPRFKAVVELRYCVSSTSYLNVHAFQHPQIHSCPTRRSRRFSFPAFSSLPNHSNMNPTP